MKRVAEEKTGLSINDNEPINDILYRISNENLKRLTDTDDFYLILSAVLLFYFLIRSFGAIFNWPISFFVVLVYEILIVFKFASVILETHSKDVIVLK